eukprot:CAMPEP_0118694090 /NCGR_PEP_ID=MMETSP0800-20121206/12292_1 /TAXON_ID=210618 ORGANISM="Striatella unipunctata, Strain CCMP2910" /NCGR_SAMPLE_ID=MMETSP0800 /ASSEMBLY_ACC=CAM_ASM_000638 /LENGTH=208 /DNA_ID=CAMNT_0006592441 /DNA_START=157 /DNA_END=783 /DNA_ORIENTATION=+
MTLSAQASQDLEMWNDSFYSDSETLIEWMLKDAPETTFPQEDPMIASPSCTCIHYCACGHKNSQKEQDFFFKGNRSCGESNANLAPELCASPCSPEEEFMCSLDELKIMDDTTCANLTDLPVHEQFMAASMNLVEYIKKSQESRAMLLKSMSDFKENRKVEESREQLQNYLSTVYYMGPPPPTNAFCPTPELCGSDDECKDIEMKMEE